MSAKNIYHDAVVDALTADGWAITHDPLSFRVGERDLHIDLGAERPSIVAQRGAERIAVEVQSFPSPSPVADLQQALGQYGLYRLLLDGRQPDRLLYLAVPARAYDGILSEPVGRTAVAGLGVRVMVFDPDRREVVRWIG